MLLRPGCALAGALVVLGVVVPNSGAAGSDPSARQSVLLGRSAEGRQITAIRIGDLDATRHALVVGCIHGNEPAGIAVARWLATRRPTGEVDLWILADLNPDGVAASTRGNARGVDLNRNFPWRWRMLHGIEYSGQRALSEPESRLVYRLITRLNPEVSVWFHQHRDLVDESGGSVAVERRFAALSGLRLARLAREPGSVAGWENHRMPSTTAFVVELPRGALRAPAVRRFGRAVLAVAEGR